jgi:hypothetical protein
VNGFVPQNSRAFSKHLALDNPGKLISFIPEPMTQAVDGVHPKDISTSIPANIRFFVMSPRSLPIR